jgi:nucleoside-diphosphate-sugar epimerase
MKALLTGSAGFIGSTLAERLLADGHSVVGVDALTDYYDPTLKLRNLEAIAASGFEFVEGDLNVVDLAPLLDGIDVVFHLAGQPGVRASWGDTFGEYVEQNVRSTQRLLEACKVAGTGRFVYASSSSIYGDAQRFPTEEDDLPAPISPYGVTKLAGEHLVRLYAKAFGLSAVALRYFTIYGPRQRPDMAFNRFIGAALNDGTIKIFGDGEQVREFTYVGDCVEATCAAATRGESGAVYNIAGGSETTVNQVIEVIGELAEKPPRVEYLEAMKGDARRTGADISRARAELGYEPRVDLREGLARQVAHAKEVS